MSIRHVFRKIAHTTATAIGSPFAFIAAAAVVVLWAACGPLFHFSDTWQLVINTSTTIVTFLVVFMIQNSQNRDSQAVHLKLDELICSVKAARNQLIDVEDLDDDELAQLALEFRRRRSESKGARADEPDQADRAIDEPSHHDEPDDPDDPDTRPHREGRATGRTGRVLHSTETTETARGGHRQPARADRRRKNKPDAPQAGPEAAASDRRARGNGQRPAPVADSPSDRARPSAPLRTPGASAR